MNPCCVWDLTIWEDKIKREKLIELLKEHCKKWCFQLEKCPETDKLHYQCRISLGLKVRTNGVTKIFGNVGHWSPTSDENRDNMFYVCKNESRIDGPWRDTDEEIFIPWDLEGIVLLPWQAQITNSGNERVRRKINILIDVEGGKGKSTVARYCRVFGKGMMIPYVSEYKDMMRMVMCMNPRNVKMWLIDMPRSINKKKLEEFYAGVEVLKGGYAWDDRYEFKDRVFDPPVVWVFTNTRPDTNLLTQNRWTFWKICDDDELMEVPLGDERSWALKL